jgi:hypothetical protein
VTGGSGNLFRVRDRQAVRATCGSVAHLHGELGRSWTGGYPMLSAAIRSLVARMWPGVAHVTSLEGPSSPVADPGLPQ